MITAANWKCLHWHDNKNFHPQPPRHSSSLFSLSARAFSRDRQRPLRGDAGLQKLQVPPVPAGAVLPRRQGGAVPEGGFRHADLLSTRIAGGCGFQVSCRWRRRRAEGHGACSRVRSSRLSSRCRYDNVVFTLLVKELRLFMRKRRRLIWYGVSILRSAHTSKVFVLKLGKKQFLNQTD